MKILVTATHVPFSRGGAEAHMHALVRALRSCGHQAELLRIPFAFSPETTISATMEFCRNFDLEQLSGGAPDRVISLQFPSWGMHHPDQVVWMLHQHRAVYELYDKDNGSPELAALREQITSFDRESLGRARRLFANSRRVAERLRHYNGLQATPLYHPPPDAASFQSGDAWDYILYPSRLETLKRQQLLIDTARLVKAPIRFVLLGEGGQRPQLEALIERHQLQDRVLLHGFRPRAEQLAWYAHSIGVFFGPRDEDLGYVTLEAMLAARPIITCTDSGGPLEFVVDGDTGLVVEPNAEAIAEAVEWLWHHRQKARQMGLAGRAAVEALDLRWERVVEQLVSRNSISAANN